MTGRVKEKTSRSFALAALAITAAVTAVAPETQTRTVPVTLGGL